MFRDHTYRVVLLGEKGVGKTSLITRYIDKTFYEDTEFSSLEPHVSKRVKSLNCDGLLVDIELWDIPVSKVDDEVLKDVQAVMYCYNIGDKESFGRLSHWTEQTDRYCSDMVCKVLVGTNSDKKRAVEKATAQELADRINIPFVETNSKKGTNVKAAFMAIVKELLKNEYPWGKYDNIAIRLDGEPAPPEGDDTSVSSLVPREYGEGCCCAIC